ncbi:condensin-2 complex subunit G2-like [Sphaerodactylus townsendi]|uniref:condensin-2 complex subunit G2-like n=1 Tax=Sphaerodactylus townsendi TaxID=933632 RepID=UPI0020272DED|nr:condensin-2 complex subunit G2-like [Sphaerodactylus townsendi]
MERREAFLQAVFNSAVDEFLNFIQLHKDPANSFDLNELLQELSRKQREALWEKLKHLLTQVLVDDPVEAWQRIDKECDDNMETEGAPQKEQTTDVIQGVTIVVTFSIPTVDENINCKDLLECALILNEILYALPDSEKSLAGAIQHLCERWWQKGLEGKERFGKTAFTLVLKNSFEKKNIVGADIIHLWQIHRALLCFDYDSEESNDVKNLLLRCFLSVNHIKKEEGRRFLSFLFTWNVNFIKMIHGTVKNQLLCFPSMAVVCADPTIGSRSFVLRQKSWLDPSCGNCIGDGEGNR